MAQPRLQTRASHRATDKTKIPRYVPASFFLFSLFPTAPQWGFNRVTIAHRGLFFSRDKLLTVSLLDSMVLAPVLQVHRDHQALKTEWPTSILGRSAD